MAPDLRRRGLLLLAGLVATGLVAWAARTMLDDGAPSPLPVEPGGTASHPADDDPPRLDLAGALADDDEDPEVPAPDLVLGTTQWRVQGLEAVSVSADGRRILATPSYGDAVLLDGADGSVLRRFDVDHAVLSADGSTVAGVEGGWSTPHHAVTFDATTGARTAAFAVPEDVDAVAVTADGRLVAAGAKEGRLVVGDGRAGKVLHELTTGAQAEVISVLFLVGAEGPLLAAGDEKGLAALWSLPSGKQLRTLPHGEGAVSALAATPDGARLVTGDASAVVRLFDPASGALVRSFETGSSYRLEALAVSADGARVVTGGHDGTLALWDVASGDRVAPLTEGSLSATAAAIAGQQIIGGASDGPVRTWGLDGVEVRRSPRGHLAPVRAMEVVGERLIAAGGDGELVVWDLNTGAEAARFGQGGRVRALDVSPDGARVAVGSDDGRVRVYSMEGALLHDAFAHDRGVRALAWSPDGGQLATGGREGAVAVVTADLGGLVATAQRGDDTISALAWSPDGALLVAGDSMGRATVLDRPHPGARRMRVVADLDETYPNTIGWLAFSPDGRTLALAADDDLILWDTDRFAPRVVRKASGFSLASGEWSPDGRTIAIGDSDGNLWLLDGAKASVRAHMDRDDERLRAVRWAGDRVAFSRDDTTIALLGVDALRRHPRDPEDEGLERGEPEDPSARRFPTPQCEPPADPTLPPCAVQRLGSARLRAIDEITTIAASADGRTLATASESDEQLDLWDARTGDLLHRIHVSAIGAGALLFVGDRLVACDWASDRAMVFEVATGRLVAVHHVECDAMELAPDGRTVAFGGSRGRVVLGDLETGRLERPLGPGAELEPHMKPGEDAKVKALVFAPDGARLGVALGGAAVLVHDLRAAAGAEPEVHGAWGQPLFLPNGRLLIAGTDGALVAPTDDDEGSGRTYDVAFEVQRATVAGGAVLLDGDEDVALWSPATRTKTVHVGPHERAALLPDGRIAVARDQALELWTWIGPALRFEGHTSAAAVLATKGDRAWTSDGATVRAWDMASGRLLSEQAVARALASADGARLVSLAEDAIEVHEGGKVRRLEAPDVGGPLALSPDGRWLAFGGADETAPLLLDLNKSAPRAMELGGWAELLAISRDGKRVAVADGELLTLWRGTKSVTLDLEESRARALAFTPDGRLVASGDGVRVFSPQGKVLFDLPGDSETTWCLAVSPDGRLVAGGDLYGDVRVWDLGRRTLLARWHAHDGDVESIAFTEDGRRIITASDDATVLVWDPGLE